MPEGDTIFRSARALQRAIGGQVCTGFETGLATLARVDDEKQLAGRTIEKVEAKGKWLLIHFSGDLILVTHMLMSGSWHLYRTGEKWWTPPQRANNARWGPRMSKDRMRVVIRTAGWQAVAFNVPVAEFHTARTLERYTQVPKLGVDVLGDGYTVETGVARLQAYGREHPEAEIAVVLLNQRVLAGLGNVYKSEVAFAAGVNPFRAMATITEKELEVMAEVAAKWMKVNVLDATPASKDRSPGSPIGAGDGISTYFGNRRTTGNSNRDDRLWVYGRQGQECRRCGGVVQMRKQGEQARSTYWCAECQPWVAAEGQSETAPVGRMVKPAGPRRRVGC